MNKDILFLFTTNDGYSIKMLCDLLSHNIKSTLLSIQTNCIQMSSMDVNKNILIFLTLESIEFLKYELRTDTLYYNINVSDLYKSIKDIKKKDQLEWIIYRDEPDILHLKIITKDFNRIISNRIKIQLSQNMSIERPTNYSLKPIILNSMDYHKTCKLLSSKGNDIKLSINHINNYIKLTSLLDNAIISEVVIGNHSEQEFNFEEIYIQHKFIKSTKIATLSNKLKIYCEKDMPLLLESNIGSLGKIYMYMKSKLFITN